MPTRSEVENWDTEHLNAAADHWSKTATVWEDCFTQYAHQVANPGGTPWEGDAADAAHQQAHSDRLIVVGLADKLHDASGIARKGALQLQEKCRLVMRSVHSAEDDGFTVGEDFSVTDGRVFSRVAAAARQAKAEAHADAIRAAVADLVAADAKIAGEITTAAEGLGKDHFAESGDVPKPPQMGVDRNPLTIEEREKAAKETKELQDSAFKGAGTIWDAMTGSFAEAAKSNGALGTLMEENPMGFSKYNGLVSIPMTGVEIVKEHFRDGENIWRATTTHVSSAGYSMAIGKASSDLVKILPKVGQAFMSGLSGVEAAGVGTGVVEAAAATSLVAEAGEFAMGGFALGGPAGAALGLAVGLTVSYFFADDAAALAGKAFDALFG